MVKQGYKQTEIGVIPEVWDYGVFSNFVKLRHGFQFLEHHFSSSGVPVIKIGTLKDSGGIDVNKFTFVSEDIFEKFKSIQLFKGDVVMALTGATLGKVSKVDYNERCLQNYRVGLFNGKEGVDNNFIYHILQSFLVQKTVKELVNSGAQPNLGKADFDKIIIPLPPLAEQEAIASALSDADAWIERLEQLIAKKRLIKQGAMQTLLTPPSHAEPVEAWEVKKLGEVFKLKQGVQCGVENQFLNDKNGYIRFIRIVDLTQQNTEERFIKDPGVEHHITETDLFMVRYGAPGVVGFGYKGVIANNLFRLIPKIELLELYFKYVFDYMKSYIEEISSSSTMAALNFTTLNNIDLFFQKSLSEQARIATILSDMDAELEALEQQLAKARLIKQGMMQELLTGRVRLV
ncbi:restriction endonuclease subunit S [Empedobacter falsenii]